MPEEGEVESPTKTAGFFFAGEVNCLGLSHHIHNGGVWRPRKVMPHPTLEVQVEVDHQAYAQLNLRTPVGGQETRMCALADTGAQMCILGRDQVNQLGLQMTDLEQANLGINTADGGQAKNLGMVFLNISIRTQEGMSRSTKQQCYVLEGSRMLFLSYEALMDLGCCPKEFPR